MRNNLSVTYNYRGELLVFELRFERAYGLFKKWKQDKITLKQLCKKYDLHYPAMSKLFYENDNVKLLRKKYLEETFK